MLLEIYDVYGCSWNFIWYLRLPIKCEKCLGEMEQVSQGMTGFKWYKDYYCPSCKLTVCKQDKTNKKEKCCNGNVYESGMVSDSR